MNELGFAIKPQHLFLCLSARISVAALVSCQLKSGFPVSM